MAAPTDPAASPQVPAPLAAPQALQVVCGLLAATFVAVLASTTVPVALPALVADLGGGASWYGWVVGAELLAAAATVPVWSRLSATRDPSTLVLGALALLVGGSVVAGAAVGPASLLAGRAGQGVGAGGVAVLVPLVLAAVLPPQGPSRFSGLFAGAFAVATLGGPVTGGVLVDTAAPGWRWSFLAGVPLALVALVLLRQARRLAAPGPRPGQRGGADVLPLRLLRTRSFAAAAVAVACVGAVTTAATVLLVLHLQVAVGHPATVAALLLLPLVGGVLAASTVSGAVVTARGGRRAFLLAGAVTVPVAVAALSTVTDRTATALVVAGATVLGVGLGLLVQNVALAALDAVPGIEAAGAGSLVAAVRLLGGGLGGVVLAFAVDGTSTGEPFRWLLPVAVGGLVAVLLLLADSRPAAEPGRVAPAQRPTA